MPPSSSDPSLWVQQKVHDSSGYLGDIQKYRRNCPTSFVTANVERGKT